MAQPFIGEIRMFAGNFAPAGWMFCAGQTLPISENDTLFNLIGTTYGGDGQETFGLPDLRGRIPLHQGGGFILAETGGAEQVTLTVAQIPAHTHPMVASSGTGSTRNPLPDNAPGVTSGDTYVGTLDPVQLSPQAVAATGGSQPHENFQPYLCINFIISMFGVYPSQT